MTDEKFDDEVKEFVAEEEKKELPEAPNSITIRAYYKGFSVLITRRTAKKPKFGGLVKVIENLVESGFQPSWHQPQSQRKSIDGALDELSTESPQICPLHKVGMQRFTKEGQTWWSHSTDLEDGTKKWCNGKGYK